MESAMSATDKRKRKRSTTTKQKRSVVSIDGIRIDENDYKIVHHFFPGTSLESLVDETVLSVNEDEGFRVRGIKIEEPDDLTDDDVLLLEKLGELNALKYLHVTTRIRRIGPWIGKLTNLKEFELDVMNYWGESRSFPLPDEIWSLNGLKKLTLSAATCALDIPSSIRNLTNLESLDVNFSYEDENGFLFNGFLFNGFLLTPTASIGDLTNLQSLTIDYRGEMQISSSILKLANLERLDIKCNKIWICSMRYLTNLKSLSLQVERATLDSTGIPTDMLDFLEISRLTTLEDLTIRIKGSTSIPEDIGRLTNLRSFLCQSENLRSIPSSISNLKNLKILDLSFASLSSIPDELGRLINLEELYLVDAGIDSLPASMLNLTNLKCLRLGNNESLTSLPEDIGRLAKLEFLDLTRTRLQSFPSSFGNLTNLKTLIIPFPVRAIQNEILGLRSLESFSIPDNPDCYVYESVEVFLDLDIESNFDASTLSNICYDFGAMKNLRCLGLPEAVHDDDDDDDDNYQLKDDVYDTILNITEQCPFLGCFSRKLKLKQDALADSLNRNRLRCFRSQMKTHIFSQTFPPSLWPCILYQATRSFSRCSDDCPLRVSALDDGYEPDVIFNILVAQGATHILSKRR